MGTYSIYVIHLMIAVPMLAVEVPFGKWAHLAYRPVAKYLAAVLAVARAQQHAVAAVPRAAAA